MKKSTKYFLVVAAAVILNLLLWKLGDDCLSKRVNPLSTKWLFFSHLLMGIVSLILIRILRWILDFIKLIPKTTKSKIIQAVCVTLVVFGNSLWCNFSNLSSIGIDFSGKRQFLCTKVEDAMQLAFGTKGKGLSRSEYNQVRNFISLPRIPKKAYDVTYLDTYDGFLPDFRKEVSYKLPKNISVSPYTEGEISYGQKQVVEEFENYNLVTHSNYDR